MDKQVNKEKVTVQDIVDGIVKMIKTGEFQSGTPLREVELCEKFGVSRTPIREALRLLQNNGIVEYIPRCGVQVVELTLDDLRHITDLRTVIETLSSEKAASHTTKEDIQILRDINHRLYEAATGEERSKLDDEFHTHIAIMSENPVILKHLKELSTRQALVNCWIPMRSDRTAHSCQEHENIIQALECKDAEFAAKQTEIHFYMSQKSLQNKLIEYENQKR